MIKWFDADKFLPGHMVDDILIRYTDLNDVPHYVTGHFSSVWYSYADERLEDAEHTVTHWAFIEEPM